MKKISSTIFHRLLKPLFLLPFTILKIIFSILNAIFSKISDKLRLSITFRMTLVYTFVISNILVLLSVGVLSGGFAYIMRSEGNDLKKDFTLVTAYIDESHEVPASEIEQLSKSSGRSISLFDENLELLYTTEKNPDSALFIHRYASRNVIFELDNAMLIVNPGHPDANIPPELFNQYGIAMVYNNSMIEDSKMIYVQIIDKLSEETEYAGIFIITLIALDIFFIILIILIGSSASKRLLKPVKVMTDTVQNISINQLGTRLDVSGSKNELKDLAKTFNSMLDRIQLAYDRQNQFVADASHELRTPISVVQGYANLLDRWGKEDNQVLEESITAIKTESENMKDLIEKLLFLARGDKDTQKLEKEDFHVNELIDEIIKETVLIDNTHEVTCVRKESIVVNADRGLLKEAIRIFVDNSVKYTPEGGKIKLECYLENHSAMITIEDTGIGISETDLPHIFDRFYRADKSRTKQTGGNGLGMAIAKWIILKHEGSIKVQSKINIGTKIYIALPK
ncbi:MAG: hypothetical protein APF77_20415 [Clostridia bacterium BRH_c25]|nr:MAG: hypothetical protein APF77_20415 [Clostridia bacterium BRH_c25]